VERPAHCQRLRMTRKTGPHPDLSRHLVVSFDRVAEERDPFRGARSASPFPAMSHAIDQALARARNHATAGQLEDAHRLLRGILIGAPDHGEALEGLVLLCHKIHGIIGASSSFA
jgi:hypothetical protein